MRLDDTGFFLHTTGANSPLESISAGRAREKCGFATRATLIGQNTPGVAGTAENGDRSAAVPPSSAGTSPSRHRRRTAGAVWVCPGTVSGVTATRSVSSGPRTLVAPVSGARFGAAFHR
ncbi:hypothetical protein ACWELV_06780 [Streptomyces mirabilis]